MGWDYLLALRSFAPPHCFFTFELIRQKYGLFAGGVGLIGEGEVP